MLRKDWSVDVGHRPHRPDDAPEPTILHRRHEVQSLVRNAFISQLRGVTCCKECEFGRWELRADNLKQRETITPVKFE
jgi:hypothetical protein